jgi:hypothetical protein
MNEKQFETPVAMFVFNRPSTTRRVFAAIAAVRPAQLLLIADGPRPNKPGEVETCHEVRTIVSQVDWPCEVLTNFSEHNLGCQERMISGLNWVFSLVEEAIILEDDCLPDPTFFLFCKELLTRYRGDGRIAYISGCSLVGKYLNTSASYFFSQTGGIWGWATWRSEWQRYDRHLMDWPEIKKENLLAEIFDEPDALTHWTQIFDKMHENRGPNTWDYQWVYTCLKNNSIIAVPSVNLISNIGFGEGATHTLTEDPRLMLGTTPMAFPLRHPPGLIPLRSVDRLRAREVFAEPPLPIWRRVVRKGRHIAAQLFPQV